MPRSTPIYLAQTQPGFEAIAADEIEQLEGAKVRGTRQIADKNGLIQFVYDGDPRDLLELRTIEDVFEQVLYTQDIGTTYQSLKPLEDLVRRVTTIEAALHRARQLRPARGGQGKLRYRVVARQVGETNFRRVDAQMAVEKAIGQRSDHRWRLEEEGALEFWLTLFPGEALLMLRLSDEKMRHRTYKLEHMPASLRPTAAAALAFLTRPNVDDVFLDPMCGAGTILVERANMLRYAQLYGGDESPEALAIAQLNIGTRYQPLTLSEWDARNLPFDAGSISAAAVNLPFGRQIGSPIENKSLYPAFVREINRVLRPGARLAMLTSDISTLIDALRRVPTLRERAAYPVMILGQRARVMLVQRVP
jgi:23S rRNA G2445 N2-methylase RlmL